MVLIKYFRQRVAWINLGSGLASDDNLSDFKRGWSTGTRTSWLCGRVFDRDAYDSLTHSRGIGDEDPYFPAYRRNEVF